jgi:hypothetical protein
MAEFVGRMSFQSYCSTKEELTIMLPYQDTTARTIS